MSTTVDRSLLDAVRRIAAVAADRILDIYRSPFEVTRKTDASPLTEADLASHRTIVDGLKDITPDIPVLSEESTVVDFAARSGWTRYWLVDPLDGTKDFVNRNDEFTVNIALIEGHAPVLGVVAVPVTGVAYASARDLGARRHDSNGNTCSPCASRRRDRFGWRPAVPIGTGRRKRSSGASAPARRSRSEAPSSSACWPKARSTSIRDSDPPANGIRPPRKPWSRRQGDR